MLILSHNTVSLNISKIKKKMIIYSLRLIKICFIYFNIYLYIINIKLNNRSYIKTDIYRSKKNLFKRCKFCQLKYRSWNNRRFKRSETTLSFITNIKRIKLLCYRLLNKYFFSFLNCKYIYSTHN